MKVISVVGARPQFIKLAPLVKTISNAGGRIEHVIVHTGQHYDYNMSKVFFNELGLPEPDHHLGVGSGEHGVQTGLMLQKIEDVLAKEKPDRVIVYGDTNSTLAGALAGAKLHISVDHVEAGLRSFNREMPEEINRALTDHCSSILFCPTENAVENLRKEGFTNIAGDGKLVEGSFKPPSFSADDPLVVNVGDIMYDSFLLCLDIAEKRSDIVKKFGLEPKNYCLATVHRAENTDDKDRLKSILEALSEISDEVRIVFPVHPRTRKAIKELGKAVKVPGTLHLMDPIGYFDMLILEKNAKIIFTDSGGMQKEAYFSKVPCVTLRDETEWVETVASGWNVLAGADKDLIIKRTDGVKSADRSGANQSIYGDGNASGKLLNVVRNAGG
jgi:UDP-N-acetylglucosamine 2-epimerase